MRGELRAGNMAGLVGPQAGGEIEEVVAHVEDHPAGIANAGL